MVKVKEEMKNSASWLAELFPDCQVLDPDGWDGKNFKESWDEKISKKEFCKRFYYSTVALTKEAIERIEEESKPRIEAMLKREAENPTGYRGGKTPDKVMGDSPKKKGNYSTIASPIKHPDSKNNNPAKKMGNKRYPEGTTSSTYKMPKKKDKKDKKDE